MTDQQRRPDADETADTWELLAQDELSRDEQAFLRALADENEADALRMEAYAPLDATFRDRMADKLSAQLAEAARLRRRRTTRFAAATAVFAAAASLLFLLRPPSAEIPEYALAIAGQVATERGAAHAAGPLQITPDSLLDIRLTPNTRVSAELTLSTFLERDGKVMPWPVRAERAGSGAFRIHGPARELLKAEFGEWDAIFVIGLEAVAEPPRQGTLPSDLTVRRAKLSYHPSSPGVP